MKDKTEQNKKTIRFRARKGVSEQMHSYTYPVALIHILCLPEPKGRHMHKTRERHNHQAMAELEGRRRGLDD